jgi:hypothetical protein
MNNTRKRPMSVGLASLFAVLIVLCLMIFAVLARLSAQSELNLAEIAARSVLAYYDAEYRAVVRLANSDSSGTFTEEIDENRELRVVFRITEEGTFIDEWVVVRIGTHEPEPEPTFGGAGGPPIFD